MCGFAKYTIAYIWLQKISVPETMQMRSTWTD